MKAIERIKRYLNPSGLRNLEVKGSAEFKLLLDGLLVGVLSYHDGNWMFKYSEEFKDTQGIRALAGFPDINKTYKSDVLWPFFSSRIPSLSRKRFKQTVAEEGIQENDVLSLLNHFGKRTITNPFELMAVE